MLGYILSILALVLTFGAVNNPYKSHEETIEQVGTHIEEATAGENQGNLPEGIPPANPTQDNSLSPQALQEPDTQKVLSFNSESETVVGVVPQVAVTNAGPLVSCEESPELCEPTSTPSPTPTPDPDPEPIPGPIPPNPEPCPPPFPISHPGVLIPLPIVCEVL